MVGKAWVLAAGGLLALWAGRSLAVPATASAQLSVDEVVQRMVAMNYARTEALHAYCATRFYHVAYSGLGHQTAEMTVQMEYHEPGPKRFTITAEAGSEMLRHHVLEPLVKAEQSDAQVTSRQGLALGPTNYQFVLLQAPDGHDQHNYVLQATPLSGKHQRFLFHGKVWVDPNDYGIVRIQGVLPDVPSFWVASAEFDYHNQKVGDFWLPETNDTIAHLRFFGHAVLTIRYGAFRFTSISPVAPLWTGSQP